MLWRLVLNIVQEILIDFYEGISLHSPEAFFYLDRMKILFSDRPQISPPILSEFKRINKLLLPLKIIRKP